MDLYIFNKNLEYQGIIDNYSSLRWVRRYYDSGQFELHCSLSPENLKLLERDNVIWKRGDDEAGYIEFRNLKLDSKGQEFLVVKGKFLTSYLDRRVNFKFQPNSSNSEKVMRLLVEKNFIDTTPERVFPKLHLGNERGFTEELRVPTGKESILLENEKISITSGLGYKIRFDYKTKEMYFEVYKGIDRTAGQNIVAPAIFSRDFENILEQEYTDSSNNYKNVGIILGARNKQTIKNKDGNVSGIDRYELFVDASNIQDMETKQITVGEYDANGNLTGTKTEDIQVEIPWSRYEPLLLEKGSEELSKYKDLHTFDSKINTKSNLLYKRDFDLGDKVTYIDKRWGVKVDTQITEIEEVYENNELEVYPVFGNNVPTLLDKIKQKLR